MEILKYLGLGLGFFITAIVSIAVVYALLDTLCEKIACRFDMELSDGTGRTYKDLYEDSRRCIDYTKIVFSMFFPILIVAIVALCIFVLVGCVISVVFGV